jgi:hypothetical protein
MLRACLVTFALLQFLAVAAAGELPTVFWFNDPVGPDDTVLVTGADLDSVTAATIGRLPDEASSADPEAAKAVAIMQASPQSLKFVVPKEFAPGIYRFTLSSPKGVVSGDLNRPTIYWIQGSLGQAAAPGEWVRVFGRNIVRRPERARLMLVSDGASVPVAATLSDGDVWRATFLVPAGMTPGSYRVRLSNGDGGDDEWIDAGVIEIRTAAPGPKLSLDVRSFGAFGDGKVNSTRAVMAALEAASRQGGGTVYFPRGRYLISEPLVIPRGVSIKGERTDMVNLVWPDFADAPDALIKGTSHFSIEDLTIYASNHGHIVSGGFDGDAPAPNASDIAIRRVRIRASAFRGHMTPQETFQRMATLQRRYPASPDSIRLSGDRLVVSDCDVAGSGRSLYVLKGSDVVVSGNILSNGRFGWYSITGSRHVIFENNLVTAGDLQGNGGGINTLSAAVTASEGVFLGHNTFKNLIGGDREAMTTDGPGGYYFGHAQSVAPDRVSLLGPLNEHLVSPIWTGAVVMVVDGAGAGQVARVAQFEQAAGSPQPSITLDRPLQIGLTAGSTITVAQMQQNYLIVDNSFEDTGVAAQTYGTALNHVIAGNRSVRTGGFFAVAGIYFHFQPGWQLQLLDNQIIEGNVYQAGPDREVSSGEAVVGVYARQPDGKRDRPALLRAIIVRGNRLEQDAHIELRGVSAASPGIRDIIVEANTIGASRVGLSVDHGVAGLIERRNVVNRIPR